MARKKQASNPTPALPELDAVRDEDTRKNIPIEEVERGHVPQSRDELDRTGQTQVE